MSNTLYERDLYAWANEQARLLRAGRLTDADIEHITEGYGDAAIEAAAETGLLESTFPAACPWSPEQFMGPDFWPDRTH